MGRVGEMITRTFQTAHKMKVRCSAARRLKIPDANASIPTQGPVHGRPMFGAYGKALAPSCLTFMSAAAMDADRQQQLGVEGTCVAVADTRGVSKSSLKLNSALSKMSVDPQTYEVFADGQLLSCEPADVLPLAKRYLLL